MIKDSPRHSSIVVFCLMVLWLAMTSWARPLMLPDEGRYVGVALEMLRSGDWLTPTLDGLPFFHKPPLFYWITAASLSLFGLSEWAARWASVIGACVAAFALYRYLVHYAGHRLAQMSCLILLSQPLFFAGAQFANLDMLVAGCISATILLAGAAVQNIQRQNPYKAQLALAYLFAALGVLAKGLIGIVIPGMVIVFWLLLLKRFSLFWRLAWWPGLVLFLLVGAPWFVAMHDRYPAFLDYFFVVQHFKRFTTSGFNNVQPMWFYPVILAVLALPWTMWIFPIFKRSYWYREPFAPTRLLMWVWLSVVVIFFSLPHSKLIGYILPAAPALSFLLADCALQLRNHSKAAQKWWFASTITAILMCWLMVVAFTVLPGKDTRSLASVMKAQRAPSEPVIFFDEYYYDLAFYANLNRLPWVVENWGDPSFLERDNWRKEVLDAAQFNPSQARLNMLKPDAVMAKLCEEPVSWGLIPQTHIGRYPFLEKAQVVAKDTKTLLLKFDRSDQNLTAMLNCPEKPIDGSPNTSEQPPQ